MSRFATDAEVGRCWWTGSDPLLIEYHDREWGRPQHDDTGLFEMLSLEAFQAGLSWLTILRKRVAFREGFRGFDPQVVARFDDEDRARLMADAGIVRNRAKVDATIGNAAAVVQLVNELGSFHEYLVSIVPMPPATLSQSAAPGELPITTPVAVALSRDLKRRGFRFVGPTIVYSFMEAVGLVDDHLPGCFLYRG